MREAHLTSVEVALGQRVSLCLYKQRSRCSFHRSVLSLEPSTTHFHNSDPSHHVSDYERKFPRPLLRGFPAFKKSTYRIVF